MKLITKKIHHRIEFNYRFFNFFDSTVGPLACPSVHLSTGLMNSDSQAVEFFTDYAFLVADIVTNAKQ